MGLFDYITGVKFTKTGREVKTAIERRLTELRQRLTKREQELEQVMSNKTLLRSYLIRATISELPLGSQIRAELPTEEHQRITELCRRIRAIEQEVAELSVVHDNLQDSQQLDLSLEDLAKLGFSPEHYKAIAPDD